MRLIGGSSNGDGLTLTHAGTGLDLDAQTTNDLQVNMTKILGTTSAGAAGYVGLDWGNINAPTTTVNLSGTTINGLDTAPPTAAAIATAVWQDATAGDFTVASSIGKSLYTSGVVPGAAGGFFIAGSNATTTVNFTGNLSGSVGSVTGAVGSVTGNVGGNVVGSVASVTARVTANTDQLAGQTVTAAAGVTFPGSVASPTNITAGTITTVSGNVNGSVGSVTGAVGSVTGNVGGNITGSIGSLATQAKTDVENAAWDAVLANHLTSGSTGYALNAAGAAGDPWSTAIPGAYAAGTAGYLVGNKFGLTINGSGAVSVDGTSPMAEVYPAKGAGLTLASALYSINQIPAASSIPDGTTTRTTYRRDGVTVAMTFALDNPTAPTKITQSS
jgi:uncharacterized protein YjbJ (UPF0337 family)